MGVSVSATIVNASKALSPWSPSKPLPWPSSEESRGLSHYLAKYDAARPPLDAIKAHADSFMECFEFDLAKSKQEAKYRKGEAIVDEDGFTLVDTTVGGGADDLIGAAEAAGGQIRRIALTHGHGDHVGSVEALKQRLGSDVQVLLGELDARIYRAYVAHRRDHLSRLLVLDPVLEPVDLRLGPGAVARHASGADNGQDGVGVGADIVI